ncbi:MAG TPA: hypothetical protein VGS07_17200 [Thermoanaerobaculia bacterium]|jgi:hypothetical protein|nr:hypothetical protein [Thermoanaerobaculia bacterium]
MRNISLWLVLVLGLLVGVPAGRLALAPQEKPGQAPVAVPAQAVPVQTPLPAATPPAKAPADETFSSCNPPPTSPSAPPPPPPPAWCEPVRLLGEFFGKKLEPAKKRDDLVQDLRKAADDAGYDLQFLVALVPAPPDPRLDQALEAVQRGFAQSEYVVERFWLPWTGEDTKGGGAAGKTAPGLLLFRGLETKSNSLNSHRLDLVFVVGETPKAGIQKGPFREALELAADLQRGAVAPSVDILGPTFSGSIESLRLALFAWRHREGERRPPLRFRAATGSATAPSKDVEEPLAAMNVEICRTVLPDETLQKQTLAFLTDEMGWDLRQVALLTEGDTAYGRSVLNHPYKQTRQAPPLVMVPFPSHISELRTATEKEKVAQAKAATATQPAIPAGQPAALSFDLTDPGRPVDLVPTFDPSTVLSNELVLENLMRAVSREGIRYVGILATDVKDTLFLAEQVRARVPDAVLFTFNNNLLYAHPQYGQTMDGMLVFSSAPLFTEGAPRQPKSLSPTDGHSRRQFSSEFQQGLFEAVLYLMERPVASPSAWIMAVGNGSLWPVARLTATPQEKVRMCGAAEPPVLEQATPDQGQNRETNLAQTQREGNGFAARDDLQILLVAVILLLLAWRLQRVALLSRVAGKRPRGYLGNRRLLVSGTVLLALAAGALLAVGSVPAWAHGISHLPRVHWQGMQIAYLLALASIYFLLVGAAARAVHFRLMPALTSAPATAWSLSGATMLALAAAWLLGGVAALALLAAGLRWLCMPGGQVELFHLRARAFSSGLSPLISLAAVGGSIYVWILWELKRRRLMVRQSTGCPVLTLGDSATAGSAKTIKAINRLLLHTLPPDRRLWLAPAVAFLPPLLFLWFNVQPVAETQGYGRLFILFLALALALSALSYYRFFRLWVWTLRILERLDNASPPLEEDFGAVAKDLDWRPIQAFGWQIPAFKTLALSMGRLRALSAARKVKLPDGMTPFENAFQDVFANETDEGSPKEIDARNRLEMLFSQVCKSLKGHASDPAVRQFVALRLAAWLRYVFAHMRSCLIGALGSGLLALVGVTAYAFQPRHFIYLAICLALGAAVGLTLVVFVQMDRNATLSHIGGGTAGKINFDRTFFSKLFTFVGIPALGIIATQFPAVSNLLGTLASQLLRFAGGG